MADHYSKFPSRRDKRVEKGFLAVFGMCSSQLSVFKLKFNDKENFSSDHTLVSALEIFLPSLFIFVSHSNQ